MNRNGNVPVLPLRKLRPQGFGQMPQGHADSKKQRPRLSEPPSPLLRLCYQNRCHHPCFTDKRYVHGPKGLGQEEGGWDLNPTCCFLYEMAAAQAAVCNVRGSRAGQEAVRCGSRVQGAEQGTPPERRHGAKTSNVCCCTRGSAVCCGCVNPFSTSGGRQHC